MPKSKIEAEFVKATKLDPDDYKHRQDFLVALVEAVNKMKDAQWDKLSEAAQDWANAAIKKVKAKKRVEDFEDVGSVPKDDDKPAKKKAKGKSKSDDDDDEDEDEESDDDEDEEEEDEKPAKKKKKAKADADDEDEDEESEDDEDSDDDESEDDEDEDEEDEKPAKKKKPAKKAAKKSKAKADDEDEDEDEEEDEDEDEKPVKKKKKAKGKADDDDEDEDEDEDDDKPAKKKKKADKVEAKPTGVKVAIKTAIVNDPEITVDALIKKLGKGGAPVSKVTVSNVRAEFRHTLKVLKDLGKLKGIDI